MVKEKDDSFLAEKGRKECKQQQSLLNFVEQHWETLAHLLGLLGHPHVKAHIGLT